ncbi:MAG TPA: methyltransferase [Stellaceae bacterium]|nr:methyltransferase [Stellaceae bacterium]
MKFTRGAFSGLVAALAWGASCAVAAPTDTALEAAAKGPQRSAEFVARDSARHPVEELEFFGIKPTDSVVEIWPFSGYWTEILGPYLAPKGTYTVAEQKERASGGEAGANAKLQAKFAADPKDYGHVRTATFDKGEYDIAPPGSVDLIVTFRNLHNWMRAGYADDAMAAFYKALKPGGILGIEDHRARPDKEQDPTAKTGYVRQDYAIALAKKAGFELVASSEINANPKDTADWPQGVWTLPPSYALGDKDRDKYAAIGEADNFVLKFRKPKS